jgi:hypothetical protein
LTARKTCEKGRKPALLPPTPPSPTAAFDRAALSGQSHLMVVHGHGTGALRKRIHSYLEGSPYVARSAAPILIARV